MMEAVYTSETSVYFNETARRYIEEWFLLARRRENLKFHKIFLFEAYKFCSWYKVFKQIKN
jgi:hypothetical protein